MHDSQSTAAKRLILAIFLVQAMRKSPKRSAPPRRRDGSTVKTASGADERLFL
jgi:hypothetical protein